MSRSVTHASFTITRRWSAPPPRVFAAFADPAQKARWFGGGDAWEPVRHSFDFRVGGQEQESGRWKKTGVVSHFSCFYQDIVPPTSDTAGRIIYSYVMHLDARKISVSQACIELIPDGDGTKFILTEYGDYLDGYDDAGSREHGTNALMDALEKTLAD
ncbi:MAG: hypothetical protein BGN82_00390 [Alphaproteobacteria bacterium 65-7]|nr:MAG: hypothetical protein BGN82_00390 [Alphaproteobacteria bacterium 65-7]